MSLQDRGAMTRGGRHQVMAHKAAGVTVAALVGALLATSCASSTPAPQAQPAQRVGVGTTVAIPAGDQVAGYASVTVYSVQDPVVSANPAAKADQGTQLATADVQVCAGRRGASADDPSVLLPLPFQVALSDGSYEGMVQDPTIRTPAIVITADRLRPYQCARGYAPFEHQTGLPITAVGWGNPDDPVYTWKVPG